MKRWISLLCVLALLMGLVGCGGEGASADSNKVSQPQPSVETVKTAQVGEYIIPESWTSTSVNDGSMGYVTAKMDTPEDTSFAIDGAYLTAQFGDENTRTLLRCELDGTEKDRVVVPMEKDGADDRSINFYCFGEDCLWFVETAYTVVDEETGEMEGTHSLHKWSLTGEELLSLELGEDFGLTGTDNFVSDLALDPEGNPVVFALDTIYFCDSEGRIAGTYASEDVGGMSFVRDAKGRIYCRSFFDNTLYTMNWQEYTLGETVLVLEGNEQIYSGGGEYDILLSSETTLSGVCFENGTITELLNWADWDLAGLVGGVTVLDEETFLITTWDLLLDISQTLQLRRVPIEEIPEKTVVTMAVAMNPNTLEWGGTWADSLDQMIASQMANFNRGSETYRVEVVTYTSAEELQLMMLSGDAPDIIDWNATAWLDDTPSLQLYAKKGYLVDLKPLFEAEGMLEEFIPSVVELVTERTGGIHAMPTNFYLITLIGAAEYVGTEPGWGISDMLSAVEQIPEDMAVWSYVAQREMLEYALQSCGDRFVDMENMTCDFTNQEFYDLLTLCRDHFPAVVDENYSVPSGGSLLSGEGTLGRLGQFASDTMRNMEASGRTFIGYPGADGNGFSMVFTDELSICALGDQQEGAWEFIKTLYTYDYQYASGRSFSSVREDTFHAREDWYLEVNGSCTEEESMAARALVYGVKSLRNYSSPAAAIVLEEAEAFFAGDKSAEQVAEIMENRVKIYLSEQS